MKFSTLTVGFAALLMAAVPAISAPQSGAKSNDAEFSDAEFDDTEFMLPDVPSEVANMFTPPEGLKIITDTTLPQMTEGLASVLMTMITAVGATTTQPPAMMLPTATGNLVPEHTHDLDNIEDMEDTEDIALPTEPVSLPIFTYTSNVATETTSSIMSAPTSPAYSNGTIVGPIDLANPGTMVTSTIPTSVNATATGNVTHTVGMPTALANSASGAQPLLLFAAAIFALGVAILAL